MYFFFYFFTFSSFVFFSFLYFFFYSLFYLFLFFSLHDEHDGLCDVDWLESWYRGMAVWLRFEVAAKVATSGDLVRNEGLTIFDWRHLSGIFIR